MSLPCQSSGIHFAVNCMFLECYILWWVTRGLEMKSSLCLELPSALLMWNTESFTARVEDLPVVLLIQCLALKIQNWVFCLVLLTECWSCSLFSSVCGGAVFEDGGGMLDKQFFVHAMSIKTVLKFSAVTTEL